MSLDLTKLPCFVQRFNLEFLDFAKRTKEPETSIKNELSSVLPMPGAAVVPPPLSH